MENWVSDHCPIAFEVKERGSVVKHTSRFFFSLDHYKDMWSTYEACKSIVKKEWGKFGEKGWESPVH